MSVRQILFSTNILLMISISFTAPVEDPIGLIQQYVTPNSDSNEKFYHIHESNFTTSTYRRRKTDEGYISLCWVESLIATEDRKNNKTNLSKQYSVILESPIDFNQGIIESNSTTCYEISGNGTNDKRMYNVTTIRETDNYVIKEHKTLYCGSGPVLSEHLISWPKLNKKRIEISIHPLSTSEWRDCTERRMESSDEDEIEDEVGTEISSNFLLGNPLQENETYSGSSMKVERNNSNSSVNLRKINSNLNNLRKVGSISLNNTLLKRDVNCTSGLHIELCHELLNHSEVLKDFQSNSSPSLVNLFFPNETFIEFFRGFNNNDNSSFNVRGTFILEIKANNSENDAADENIVSLIEVIENSIVTMNS